MIEERPLVGWGYRALKVLLLVLVLAGAVCLAHSIISRLTAPGLEEHRPQLDRLDRAYESRRAELIRRAGERVESAPNEVLAIQYQQELNSRLARLEKRYFADRRAIIDSDYRILEESWGEAEEPGGDGEEDEATPTR